ncbi:MAG: SDR family NAD(P)-dependent oxidoreductase [Planctomycetota bacterium]|nr:MAG: SDR family NAD(P)-dependent oxidoreductase [Planctomycetota bacterium]
MNGRLQNKNAIVTGAGTGLGRSIAETFAREGAFVVLIGRRRNKLEQTLQSIENNGGSAEVASLDVAEIGAMDEVADRLAAEHGKVDLLVANAGIVIAREAVLETTEEDWQETLRVNLTGVHRSCKAVLRHMVPQRSGNLVTIASICGQTGMAKRTSYGASKFGVVGYTRNIAVDYARFGIRANSVCPGFVETDINREALHNMRSDPERWSQFMAHNPLGFGQPEDVANACLFLCSDEARWITGIDLSVDGGYTAA